MRLHAGSTLEKPVRSTGATYQVMSRIDPQNPMRDSEVKIEESDRCLIVEDNFFIFMAIEDIVASFGFKLIDRASSLAEAKEHLTNNRYRLALLDFRLGVSDSMPLVETLETNKIPFAVTTGYSVDDVMIRALKGAPVISKPYVIETVNRVIRQLLSPQSIG